MNEIDSFRQSLAMSGIIGYSPSQIEYLLNVTKICMKQAGIPLGLAIGVKTAGAGSVMVPGIGAVPGWVIGTLSGFITGTLVCTMARGALKPELDKLLQNRF